MTWVRRCADCGEIDLRDMWEPELGVVNPRPLGFSRSVWCAEVRLDVHPER